MRAFCVSYRGSLTTCHAGIDIETKRDQYGRVPCAIIRGITGEIACDRLEISKDVPVELGVMTQMLARAQAGQCVKCGQLIEAEMDMNNNVVALPCRHVIRHERT